MGGFSLAEADLLRRAISKKNETIILEQKTAFMRGAQQKGYTKNDAEKVFNDILKFADYGFNKSHSVVYAMTTMALALLKTNHPHAFYSELLPSVMGDAKKFQQLRQELKAFNIKLLLPDVNRSTTIFETVGNNILFPLSAIFGINNATAALIVELRNEQPFISVEDFFYRAFDAGVKDDELIALIEGGALDAFTSNRAYLKAKLDAYLPTLETRLFSSPSALSEIIVTEVNENQLEKIEQDVMRLRFPLSNNPLDFISLDDYTPLSNVINGKFGFVQTFGLVTNFRTIKTRKGEQMAFATLSNYDETLDLVIFPKDFALLPPISKNTIYKVSGRFTENDGTRQIVVETMERYNNE